MWRRRFWHQLANLSAETHGSFRRMINICYRLIFHRDLIELTQEFNPTLSRCALLLTKGRYLFSVLLESRTTSSQLMEAVRPSITINDIWCFKSSRFPGRRIRRPNPRHRIRNLRQNLTMLSKLKSENYMIHSCLQKLSRDLIAIVDLVQNNMTKVVWYPFGAACTQVSMMSIRYGRY